MSTNAQRPDKRQTRGSALRRLLTRRGWYAVMGVIWLVGYIGFMRAYPDFGRAEAVYRALQLFVGEYYQRNTSEGGEAINVWLHVARIAAPLVTIVTVADAFSSVVRLWIRRLWQVTHPDRRDVVLGLGAVGHALVRHLVSEGRLVTAVDQKIDASDRALADDVGLLVIEGDLSERRVLNLAYLHRAQNVYVACGSDEANIEIGALAASVLNDAHRRLRGPGTVPPESPATTLHVHLSSTRLVADLGDARDLGFVRGKDFVPFSLKTGIARDLMVRARFVQRAADLGQTRVHLVLCGLGDHGEALLIEALLTAYSATTGAPRITVFDREADHAKQRLAACYSALTHDSLPGEVRPEIDFVSKDLRTLDMENDPDLAALEASGTPPTAYVFACGDDLVNLGAGLRLEMAMQHLRRLAVPIHIRLWDRVIGPGDLEAEDPLSLVRTFGNARQTAARLLSEAPATEALARDLHTTYLEPRRAGETATAAQARMDADWAALPEHARRSNLRLARQAATKLMSLGLQWRGMDQGGLPRLSEEMMQEIQTAQAQLNWAADGDADLAARLVASARAEHSRWMIDRAIEGFHQGPTLDGTEHHARRDNARRQHNLMKSFDLLDDADKPSDLALLTTLIRRPTDMDAPLARWRSVAKVSLDAPDRLDGTPLAEATELEITLNAGPVPVTQEALAAMETIARRWVAGQQACRLHVRLGTPMREVQAEPAARSRPIAPEVRALLAAASAPGLVIDVTRMPPE
jgi:hypothetical protein